MSQRTISFHEITPVPAPRWPKRKFDLPPAVLKYIAFREELQLRKVWIPMHFYHIVFMLPMPQSWSKKKKLINCYADHEQTPDKDNLEKGVLDSVFPDDDSHISRGLVTKVWSPVPGFLVADRPLYTNEPTIDVKMYLNNRMVKLFGDRASHLQFETKRFTIGTLSALHANCQSPYKR